MKSTELLGLVILRLPYSDQVKDIDVVSEPNALRFTWRGNRYRVEEGRSGIVVEEITGNDGFLGSDISILMQELLNRPFAVSESIDTAKTTLTPPGPPNPPRPACARCGHDYADHYRGSGNCCVLDCPCGSYRNPEAAGLGEPTEAKR